MSVVSIAARAADEVNKFEAEHSESVAVTLKPSLTFSGHEE